MTAGRLRSSFDQRWRRLLPKGVSLQQFESIHDTKRGNRVSKISTNWWFDNQAEEAANFYTSVFPRSGIVEVVRYPDAGKEVHGQAAESVMTVDFELDGSSFVALNGGPLFKINPSVSFFANYDSKEEIDAMWTALSKGGTSLMPLGEYPFSRWYGWVQDRFGVSWQLMLPNSAPKQRIVPCLLFVGERCGKAREAIDFYTSVFDRSNRGMVSTYGPDQPPNKEDMINYGELEIEGQLFTVMESALDHQFGFDEGTSFVVNCGNQAEIDRYWSSLSAVPEAEQCGWLKDRFGVSWQIVPGDALAELMKRKDNSVRERVMAALLKMKKLDIDGLRNAAEQQ